MKKTVLKTFSLLLVILILLITVSCGADDPYIPLKDFSPNILYTLDLYHCQSVFGCTPEEFFDLELDIYKDVKDFRKDARISSDGNLVLSLSKPQREALINSDLFDYSQYPNIEVSYENRSVIVNGYAETAYEDVRASYHILNKACLYLSLKSEPVTKVTVKYVIRDGVTGEVFFSTVWPQNKDIYIPIHEYNFSPLPK